MSNPVLEGEWVQRLKDPERQQEALSELRARLVRGLKNSFSSLDVSFAEDVAQDTLLRVLERIDQFQGRSQFPTWAMSIAVRLGTSQVRRKHFKDVSLDQITGGEGLQIEIAVDNTTGACEAVEQEPIYEKLHELIGNLSDRQQAAMRALLGGMPVEEIAKRTDSNRNAVYKLVHDARSNLRRGLELAGYSTEDLLST